MLRSIPPRTSTGAGGHHLRGADPVRYRTGIRRAAVANDDEAPQRVNRWPKSTVIRIGPRPPLCCAHCGGTELVGARCNGTKLEVECLSCGGWHSAKEKADIGNEARD